MPGCRGQRSKMSMNSGVLETQLGPPLPQSCRSNALDGRSSGSAIISGPLAHLLYPGDCQRALFQPDPLGQFVEARVLAQR